MKNIVISRTDNLGDVILTLPVATILKRKFPESKVFFLGKTYTKDIVALSRSVDEFLNWDELREKSDEELTNFFKDLHLDAFIHVFPQKKLAQMAKKVKVSLRIGTAHRLYHWPHCNRLLFFSRKRSKLHEAQLNAKLLSPLGIKEEFSLRDLGGLYDFELQKSEEDKALQNYLAPDKFNLILHPLSNMSAQEWGQDNFSSLINLLDKTKFNIIITGTSKEGERLKDKILSRHADTVQDTTGKLSLRQLIRLIGLSDGIIAASTGPLHIGASLGIRALGLYADKRIIGPQRWAPLGPQAEFLKTDSNRAALDSITPESVLLKINSWV